MSDWRTELTRDGVTAKQKRMVFEILKGTPEISFVGIKKALENRGAKRFTSAKLRKFLNNEPKIEKITSITGSISYKLSR